MLSLKCDVTRKCMCASTLFQSTAVKNAFPFSPVFDDAAGGGSAVCPGILLDDGEKLLEVGLEGGFLRRRDGEVEIDHE